MYVSLDSRLKNHQEPLIFVTLFRQQIFLGRIKFESHWDTEGDNIVLKKTELAVGSLSLAFALS